MKNVFIFDPFVEGHHDFYNDLLIEALLAKGGCQIYLITSQEIYNRKSYQKWKTLSPDFNVITLKVQFCGESVRPWHFQEIHELIKQYNPVHIYIQILDLLIYSSLFQFIKRRKWFNIPWSAIYFKTVMPYKNFGIRSEYLKKRKNLLKEEIKFRYIKKIVHDSNLVSIHVLDEFAVDYYNNSVKRPVFKHIADPVTDPYFENNYDIACLRKMSGISARDYLYLGCGFHNKKKGTHILLKAFIKLKEFPQWKQAKLYIVGQLVDNKVLELLKLNEIKELISKDDIIMVNRHLTQEELLYYFRISDCICTPYINHIGGSGVLIRGLVMNKQIISTDQNWVGYYLKKHRLGVTCAQNDVDSLCEAMKKVYKKNVKYTFNNRDFFRSSNFQKSLIGDLSF